MNNSRAMFSRKSDEWSTPDDFFRVLDSEFHFDLDPCADETNHKCEKYFTKSENGLTKAWGGTKFFAIRHTVRLASGYARLMRKAEMRIRLWSY